MTEFDWQLEDGRIAHCWQADRVEYEDAVIDTGLVEGIEPDNYYLCIRREGDEPLMLLLRKDEMMSITWLCNGAIWSGEMMERGVIGGRDELG